MVAATESSELFIAVIAFFTLAVRHPVLLQVTVLKAGGQKSQTEYQKSADVCVMYVIIIFILPGSFPPLFPSASSMRYEVAQQFEGHDCLKKYLISCWHLQSQQQNHETGRG